MTKKTIWMVRAGVGGYLFEDFIKNKAVAIGWNRIKNLAKISSKKEIKEIVKRAYPEEKEGQIYMSAGQISKFRLNFNIGDYVITYNPQDRKYWIAEIVGDYEYNKKLLLISSHQKS